MEKEGIILPVIMLLSIAIILFSIGRITGFFVNDGSIENQSLEEKECIESCCEENDAECEKTNSECIKNCKATIS